MLRWRSRGIREGGNARAKHGVLIEVATKIRKFSIPGEHRNSRPSIGNFSMTCNRCSFMTIP